GLELPEALERVTYSIPRSFSEFRNSIMRDDTFLESQELEIVRDDDTLGVLVLIRWSITDGLVGSGRYVVMALSGDPDNTNRTLLATVAYERNFYQVIASRTARAIRDTIVGELERRFNEHRPFETTTIDNTISGIAYTKAVESTYSKVSRTRFAFRDVPASFRTMIMITIFFMIALFVFYFTNFEGFDFKSFIETFAIALLALMTEIGIPLREE